MPFELSDLDPRTRSSIQAYDDVAGDYQLKLRTHRPLTDVKRFAKDLARGTVVLDNHVPSPQGLGRGLDGKRSNLGAGS